MAWSWAYLALSVIGLILVANAFWPLRVTVMLVPSFFAAWYTGEMPVWHIVWQAVVTVAFAFAGAFGYWPAWVGLCLTLVAWGGLVVLARVGDGAAAVLRRAEEEVVLPVEGVPEGALPANGRETMWRWPRLVYPLPRPARSVTVVRNVDYVGDGERRHRLDVIRRRRDPPRSGAPVLLHIHGGAWTIGDKREQGFPLMHELARRGWVCVTINYALSPRFAWPEHVVDCKRALRWVRENIAAYGGDPGFVAVTGGSAGGHLAALVALTAGDARYQPGFEEADTHVEACVPIYGVYDMTRQGVRTRYDEGFMALMERQVFKVPYAENPELFSDASPVRRVHAEAPPTFVIHGLNDTIAQVDDARCFVTALREVSHAPVLYAELPRTQHAFDVLPSIRTAHTVAAVVRFLENVRRLATAPDRA
jgi:acetyl esterase/lipase